MNNKAQIPANIIPIFWAIGALFLASIFIPIIISNFNSVANPPPACNSCCTACVECPICLVCNYTPYQDNLSICLSKLDNLSAELRNRPTINKTIVEKEYIPLPQTEIVYSYVFLGFSAFLVLFFSFKFHLFKIDHIFKIEIKEIPEEWKKELERLKGAVEEITKSIRWAKWIIGIFTFLVIVKLIFMLFA